MVMISGHGENIQRMADCFIWCSQIDKNSIVSQKAGSIISIWVFVQYAVWKPADPLEIRIYPGAMENSYFTKDENGQL